MVASKERQLVLTWADQKVGKKAAKMDAVKADEMVVPLE